MNIASNNDFRSGVVALIGPPNAGKSTLLNTILGQKVAIVSPKPQTTRNRISGIHTTGQGQIVFLDTPGIHTGGKSRLNRFIVNSAWQALASAEAVILLLDGSRYVGRTGLLDREITLLKTRVERSGLPILVAVNKIDRIKDKTLLLPLINHLREHWPAQEFLPVSALRGQGVEELVAKTFALLPEAPPLYPEDQVSTVPLRFLASETVREKLFLALRQELPYSVAVDIESWEESETLARIDALIYVARDTHKSMVIGKGGQQLKSIGQAAREEIQDLLGKKVHLQLWVKVKENWPDNPNFLLSLGLGE
ncbi:MAG: GTPase Era [Desulfovibrionales bacterium]